MDEVGVRYRKATGMGESTENIRVRAYNDGEVGVI